VAARKKRPVLYEVFRPGIRSGDPGLKPRPFRAAHEPERPAPADERDDIVIRDTTPTSSVSVSSARHRRTLTVSTSTLTLVIAGMIVVLFVAFAAGRRYESFHPSAHTPANLTLEDGGEAETRTTLAADTDPAEPKRGAEGPARPTDDQQASPGARRTASDPAPPPPTQVTLQRGRHYVVVQHFNKSRQQADALAAARFLQESGVPCATLTGADIRLIATENFLINQTDAAAGRRERQRANRLLERIRQLGQQYNRELLNQGKKGYTFSECYLYLIR
jgi:hypothetical protein